MMVPTLFDRPPAPGKAVRALSEDDAVDIWIARWLKVPRKDILARYGCDPRRLYEIWEGKKHPGSRAAAFERFRHEYPGLLDRIDFGCHRPISRKPPNEDQLALFD